MQPAQLPSKIVFAHSLRGIAALIVVIGHIAQVFWTLPSINTMIGSPPFAPKPYWFTIAVDSMLPAGFLQHFPVALFFIISGFVIPFSLIDRSRLQFAISRFLRLWPTYAIGLSISCIFIIICANWFGAAQPFSWHTYMLQLLFVRDLAWVPSIDGVVWTLEIEAKFYVLMLLLAGPLRAGRIWPLILTAFALLCLTVGAVSLPGWLKSGEPIYQFLYGMTLSAQMMCFMFIGTAFNFYYRGLISLRITIISAILFFLALAAQWPIGTIQLLYVSGLTSYAIAAIVFALAFIWRGKAQQPWPGLNWLANISYPRYVIHAVAGWALMRMALDAGWGLGPVLTLGFSFGFLAAVALHYWVERPTQALGKRLAARLGASSARPTAVNG